MIAAALAAKSRLRLLLVVRSALIYYDAVIKHPYQHTRDTLSLPLLHESILSSFFVSNNRTHSTQPSHLSAPTRISLPWLARQTKL